MSHRLTFLSISPSSVHPKHSGLSQHPAFCSLSKLIFPPTQGPFIWWSLAWEVEEGAYTDWEASVRPGDGERQSRTQILTVPACGVHLGPSCLGVSEYSDGRSLGLPRRWSARVAVCFRKTVAVSSLPRDSVSCQALLAGVYGGVSAAIMGTQDS